MTELKEALSERELEILRLVATGAANKEIARQLVISPNTVKVHMRNIFAKIGVASRTEATLYALQIGLVNPAAVESSEENGGAAAGLQQIESIGDGVQRQGAVVYAEPRAPDVPARPALKRWQIGLVAMLALALIGSGAIFGARLLAAATPTPAAAPPAGMQVTVQRWSSNASLPDGRKGMGVVAYENAFYLLAGENDRGLDPSTMRFDLAERTWKTLAKKPTPVSEVHAALLGEKIYVPGGKLADGSLTKRLEVYNPREDDWTRMADLPVAVSGYALAALDGRLYLFGGKAESGYLADVYEYDPQEDRWQARASMDHPRAHAGAAVVDGKIYVMGGYDGKRALKLNQAYMPSRDDSSGEPWETYAPLPKGSYGMGMTELASTIYLIGGWNEDGEPNAAGTQQYMVQADQWATFDGPPQASGALPGFIASGNFLYVLGGETDAGPSEAIQTYQAIYTIAVPLISSEAEK